MCIHFMKNVRLSFYENRKLHRSTFEMVYYIIMYDGKCLHAEQTRLLFIIYNLVLEHFMLLNNCTPRLPIYLLCKELYFIRKI